MTRLADPASAVSKDYLRGEAEGKPYVHDQAFYEENSIELLCSTRVTGLDAGLQELMLEGDVDRHPQTRLIEPNSKRARQDSNL